MTYRALEESKRNVEFARRRLEQAKVMEVMDIMEVVPFSCIISTTLAVILLDFIRIIAPMHMLPCQTATIKGLNMTVIFLFCRSGEPRRDGAVEEQPLRPAPPPRARLKQVWQHVCKNRSICVMFISQSLKPVRGCHCCFSFIYILSIFPPRLCSRFVLLVLTILYPFELL